MLATTLEALQLILDERDKRDQQKVRLPQKESSWCLRNFVDEGGFIQFVSLQKKQVHVCSYCAWLGGPSRKWIGSIMYMSDVYM